MKQIKEIDGLRALAILMVVAWHYLGTTGGPASTSWKVFIFGRTGVDLFFVLSGYLITSILLSNRNSPTFFSAFYGRRAFRILPIYFIMVAVYLVGRSASAMPELFAGKVPWWTYLIGAQNFAMAWQQDYGALWLGGTWSLAIEEQFYLIFPLIVYFIPVRALPRFLIALLIICPIARGVAAALHDGYAYYVLMPLRADILAIGALIAWAESSGAITDGVRAVARNALIVTVALIPVFLICLARNSDFHMAAWGHTYLVVFYGALLFTVLQSRGSARLSWLRGGPAHFFAKISYALYLVHLNVWVLLCLAIGVPRNLGTWAGIAGMMAAFVVSIALCQLSFWFIEAPLIGYARRRFEFRERGEAERAKYPGHGVSQPAAGGG